MLNRLQEDVGCLETEFEHLGFCDIKVITGV
jgi:hypothetical protein